MRVRTLSFAIALTGACLGTVLPAQAQNNAGNVAAGAIIGGTAGALIGGAVTGNSGGVAAGALIGGTTGAIIGSQQPGRSYYGWANDGRCYLHRADGAVVRVSRGYCQ